MGKLKDHLEHVRNMKLLDEQRIRLREQRIHEHQRNQEKQRLKWLEDDRVLRENRMARRREDLERTRKFVNAPLQPEVPKKDSSEGKGSGRKNPRDAGKDRGQEKSQQKSRAKKSIKRAANAELDKGVTKKPKSKEFISTDDDSDSEEGKKKS